MNSLLLAIQFLSILPLRANKFSEKNMAWALVYFPVVGLFLGGVLVGLNILFSILNTTSITINIILVISLIILTAGMHLDGLADTADAFLSGKEKKEMLGIMRDPHIGAMGVLSLISVILLKVSLLSMVSVSLKPIALMLMCSLSRWAAVATIFFFPYARQEGKAGVFIKGMNLKIFIISSIAVVIFAAVIWQIKGAVVLMVVTGFSCVLGKFSTKKIGGITGDTLGAEIEITEIITLFMVFMLGNINY
ncbi:MAG: adenosylcobinamide-GDP ribazoletransferase [Candidatus Omnitrophica bacterium]|nr:adenosylcobinamide-GDP ribazoletransferase [Candidatus Omnitrophota bacterium]